MRKLLILGAMALALSACTRAEPGKANADPRDGKTAAAPPSQTALTAAEAFRLAFGKPAPAARTVARGEPGNEETLTYTPAKLVPVGDVMALVSTATNSSDCHACSGALAIHYFKREGSGWALAGSWPEILGGNGFGAPPEWRIRTDLGRPAYLVSETGWSGQGYTCASTDLVELTPQAPLVQATAIPMHYDNAGVGTIPVVNIDGKLDRGPDGKLRVTFTGSKTGFVDYELVGGKFTRVSPADLINDC